MFPVVEYVEATHKHSMMLNAKNLPITMFRHAHNLTTLYIKLTESYVHSRHRIKPQPLFPIDIEFSTQLMSEQTQTEILFLYFLGAFFLKYQYFHLPIATFYSPDIYTRNRILSINSR